MEYVLRLLGALTVALGVFVIAQAIANLVRAGVALQPETVIPLVRGGVGIVVVGILFLGFGTVISLLRKIKHNTEH